MIIKYFELKKKKIDNYKFFLLYGNNIGLIQDTIEKYIKTFVKGNIYNYDHVINAAGGYSLEVAELFGIKTDFKILPFKGLYLKSIKKVESFQRHIYPVPDIKQPFLGIHTTLTSDNY